MTETKNATRGRLALTHRGVEALRPDETAYRLCDTRCSALAIRVAPSGAKTWDVAYRVRGSGVYRRLSLGPFPSVSLDAARIRALELTDAAKAGRDLLDEERAAKAAADARLTVGQLVELYMSRKVRGRLKTAAEMQLRFNRTFASLKDRYADELRRRDLREVLDRVADRGALREAQQQRQLMRVIFKWALSQDLIDTDPAAALATFGPSPRRDRVLTADEIRALWDWMGQSDMPRAYVDALRFQLATGARIGEVGGITSAEIDRDTWVWTLPAERSKNGRSRVTPLVGFAKDIVAARLEASTDGPLFLGDGGAVLKSNDVGTMLVKRRKQMPIAHFTSHDLRRTVATGLVDLGFPFELVAAVLGHEAGSKNVRTLLRHYVRSDLLDRKESALQAWDKRLRRLMDDALQPTNVRLLYSCPR